MTVIVNQKTGTQGILQETYNCTRTGKKVYEVMPFAEYGGKNAHWKAKNCEVKE